MIDRRQLLNMAFALAFCPPEWAAGIEAEDRGTQQRRRLPAAFEGLRGPSGKQSFPITVQISPLPNGAAWKDAAPSQARRALRAAIDQVIDHGFTGIEYPIHLTPELDRYVTDYARSKGMFLTYNHTFAKGGVENFGRNTPPSISVYAAEYALAIRKNLVPVLAEGAQLLGLHNMFCYQDEPFHAGPESFDLSDEAMYQFRKRFGYELPLDVGAARNSPREWLDLINFQSDEFPVGWRQVYKIIKESNPRVKVVLTHDSHSALGAGVGSNSKLAVDDIFHWGADFADTFVFDIYPYMMFDYRYGELGKIRKPRLSQMHFAFAQLRNLTYTYKKEMGFWFGTYNREWFKDFMGPELKAEDWAETEICYTAVGQGADFLISGYKIPEDSAHWELLGEGLQVLQRAGPNLLRCPKVKAKACFLFPRTQYIQLQEEYWNVAVAYELFLQAFGELDSLHEEQVTDANLGGYKILVLFDIQLLPEAVAKQIVEFVKAGGVVIADCVPSFDAYRKRMDVMAELFGVQDAQVGRVKRSGVWVPSLTRPRWFVHPSPGDDEDAVVGENITGKVFGESCSFRAISPRACQLTTGEILLEGTKDAPALIRKKYGEGQAFLFGFCMQDTYFQTWKDQDLTSRASLERLVHAVTREAGVVPHIVSANPEIEACLRANHESAYVFVINHEAEDSKTSVGIADLEFAVAEIFNVTEGRNVKFQVLDHTIVFDAEAPRQKPQLLRLLASRKPQQSI